MRPVLHRKLYKSTPASRALSVRFLHESPQAAPLKPSKFVLAASVGSPNAIAGLAGKMVQTGRRYEARWGKKWGKNRRMKKGVTDRNL
jgi:hypothetical protein